MKAMEAISRSKDTYKVMCGNKTEENKNRYKACISRQIKWLQRQWVRKLKVLVNWEVI